MNDELEIYCLECGELIERKNLKLYDYKRRKFCSQSCAASYNNRITKRKEKKKCKNCGKELSNNKKLIATINANTNIIIKFI